MTRFFVRSSAKTILLFGAAAVFAASCFAFIVSRGVVNALIDSKSNLLQTSQILLSMTPGVSQLGFWPPLLRVLLLPSVSLLPFPLLFYLGGFLSLLPLQLTAAFFMHELLRLSGVSRGFCLMGSALLVLQPFIQYFTASSMTEIPLITCLLGAAYYARRWEMNDDFLSLFLFAVFVSLSSLARYEGLALIPMAALFILYQCVVRKKSFDETKALFIMFTVVAMLGVGFILGYSVSYGGSLLSFMSLGVEWTARIGGPARKVIPLSVLIVENFRVFVHASMHMQGAWMVAMFPACLVVSMALRRKLSDAFIVAFLLSPAMFVLLMMVLGRNTIAVEELPLVGYPENGPFKQFANTRYALTWIGAMIVCLVFALDAIIRRAGFLRGFLKVVLVGSVFVLSVGWFWHVFVSSDFSTIRRDNSAGSSEWTTLIEEYDSGRVLMARYAAEGAILMSRLPLGEIISENNYQYFDQALNEPWLFVRWVVIPKNPRNVVLLHKFAALEKKESFHHYYELRDESADARYYRLRDRVLWQDVEKLGYDPMLVPSLSPRATWKPMVIYQELKRSAGEGSR